MEGLARSRGLAQAGPIAVLLAGAIVLAVVRDLTVALDHAQAVQLILGADAALLGVMAIGVVTLRLRPAELGLEGPAVPAAVIGVGAALSLQVAALPWPNEWRPGVAVSWMILAVVVEEVCFRGVLFGALHRFGGPAGAVLGSAAAFALAHAAVYPARGLILVAVAGGLLGVLRLIAGNLAAPIAAHLVLNLSVLAVLGGPANLFLDSYQPPQPYRFVSPPPGFAGAEHTNPSGGDTLVPLAGGSSDPASAFTDDGQVTLSFTGGAFGAPAGQTAVNIHIAPVKPQPAAPSGLIPDGNAYAISATYMPSGQPVAGLNLPVLLDFRYPTSKPDAVYRIDGSEWTGIGGSAQVLLQTIDARTVRLGTFIAAHHAVAAAAAPPGPWQSAALIGGLGLAVVILLLLVAGVRIRRR